MTVELDEKIRPIVEAAFAAGFHVYVPKPFLPNDPRPAGYAYVALDPEGPFATVQRPTHNWDPAHLDVPIAPSREYGSSVLVDWDGETIESALEALRKACESPKVTVRFVAKRGQAAPVVPNHGIKALTRHSNKTVEDDYEVWTRDA